MPGGTNSPLVSRQHCLVHVTKDEAILRDLGSTNGTLVNGKRVLNERQLIPGDLLQIGPVVFEFRDESADAVSSAQTIRVDPGTKVSTGELPVVELIEPSSVHSRSFQAESTNQLTGGR